MKTVGISTLKNQLSEHLRAAQAGERVTVTSRGAPVADLAPHAPQGLDPNDELLRMARAGEIRLGNPNAKSTYPLAPEEHRLPHDEVMAILDGVRGD